MPTDERTRWEERYADGGACRDGPSEFLIAHAPLLRGRVLDVAAGSGRNALFLARRGHIVEALDIAHAGLRLARAAARAEGLAVFAVQADLRTYPLPRNRYGAAVNIRYLQRSLFAPLRRAVIPGGLIVFETFLVDQQRLDGPHHPGYLLQRGELKSAFPDCEILRYEEGLVECGAQPAYLARLLARRPADERWD
jgi:tellurite methyltransferase